MSVDRRYYLINGYDLTGMDCDKLEDWKWTDEGEDDFFYKKYEEDKDEEIVEKFEKN